MTYIVVSGIPGSGKSTLAQAIAPLLGLPLLDKDTFLERAFEEVGEIDAPTRTRLSRRVDAEFAQAAAAVTGGLLVTWWRHPDSAEETGTPTAWLHQLSGVRIELHCECDPGEAARRFTRRARHPGHRDDRVSDAARAAALAEHAARGPLGITERIVTVRTDGPIDVAAAAARLRAAL